MSSVTDNALGVHKVEIKREGATLITDTTTEVMRLGWLI